MSISATEKKRKAKFRRRQKQTAIIVFIAIVLVVVAIAAIWQKSRDPKTPTLEQAKSPAPVRLQGNLLEQIKTSRSIDHLNDVSEQLDEKFKSALLPGRIEILNQLIAIGERMTVIAKTDREREVGKKKMIRALNTLFALNWGQKISQSEVREQLSRLASELVDSEDAELSINAHIGLIEVAGLDLTKSPDSAQLLEKFTNRATTAAKKHPNEYEIAVVIDLFLLALPELRFDPEKFLELQNKIRESYGQVNDFFVQRWLNSLPDRVVFKKHKLDGLIHDIELDIPGAPAAILDAVSKILEEKLSTSGWGRLLSIGNVLETRRRWDEAAQLYALLLDRIGPTSEGELEAVKRGCQNGQTRIALVSRKFNFGGVDYANVPLTDAEFLGNPVIIVYATSIGDLQDAKQILIDARGSLRRDLKMILVCHEMEQAVVKAALTNKDLGLIRLVVDPNRESVFASQCPVELTPYVILVNHLGIVEQIAVQAPQLFSSLNQVIPDR